MNRAELLALLIEFADQAGLDDVRKLHGNGSGHGWWQRHNLIAAVKGKMQVAGHEVTLRVGLPGNFPFKLPVIQLDQAPRYPQTPHIEADGTVCYIVPRGLVVDRHSPMGVLHYALERAVETLRRGWEENTADEFMDEFGAYWLDTAPQHVVQSFLRVDEQIRLVRLKMAPRTRQRSQARRSPTPARTWAEAQTPRKQELRRKATTAMRARRALNEHRPLPRRLGWVFDDAKQPSAFHQREQQKGWRNALYVPLPSEARVRPPRTGKNWAAEDVRAIVRGNLTPEGLRTLDQLTGKRGDELLIILALPRPRGGTTLVGLRYFGLKGHHPLAAASPQDGITPEPEPVLVQRLDRPLVTARGGASPDLNEKRVLLIGCGSVGGHLATMLATAGVGNLTLLDHDRLAWENVFRHVLGKKALGRRKVEALAAELRDRIPYVEVRGIPETLDTALRTGAVNLKEFDLIISATGEPAVDLDLNARIQALSGPPAIFTWLEPFGIGGHAALSMNGEGCFECLFTPDEEDDVTEPFNRAAFYAQTQPKDFNLDEVGCGSFYAPFSDLDARQTADLAARLALSVLGGSQAQSVIRGWKGDPTDFLAAGYNLSRRHAQSSEDLRAGVNYTSPHCLTCGTSR